MANRFWVGGTGNWSDALNHWSASTGGAPNASEPTSSDNVYFDANSFDGASQVVTVDAHSTVCLAMDWTGATNTPTLSGAFNFGFYSDVTFISAMVVSFTGNFIPIGTTSLDMGGLATSSLQINNGNPSTLTLLSDFVTTGNWRHTWGTIITGGYTVTCGGIADEGNAGTQVWQMGSSIINCTAWNYTNAANPTSITGTGTIKVTGTGVFSGQGKTYYAVELNGTAHTISGSNTFRILSLNPAGAQTITFTDTTTQTVVLMERTGSGLITLQGSGAGGWTLTKTSHRRIGLEDMSISRSIVIPRRVWYAPSGIDGGNNVDWLFENLPLSLPQLRR